jgi:hypothetical protein
MHTNQTLNFLTIDNPILPFPSEVQDSVSLIEWDKVQWNTIGLPAFNCNFRLVGDQLYFESDSQDSVKLKQSDYTGQALVSGVLTPANSEEVFFLTFEISFCGGKLTNSELTNLKKESREQYEIGFKKFQSDMVKDGNRRKSWWFKYLYTPYYYILSVPTMLFVGLIELYCRGLVWFVSKFLPFKL